MELTPSSRLRQSEASLFGFLPRVAPILRDEVSGHIRTNYFADACAWAWADCFNPIWGCGFVGSERLALGEERDLNYRMLGAIAGDISGSVFTHWFLFFT